MTLHFLSEDTTQKIDNYVIIASLKRETIGKLINIIPGSCLLMLRVPGSA